MSSLGTSPKSDEIEVTIFGPGIGECIVVHVGDGRWISIDCAKLDKKPWPLTYFNEIGVRPDAIELIVASHWHADHVDGISAVVAATPNAQFVCSQALRTDEFKRLLKEVVDSDQERIRAPLQEIRAIFDSYWDRRKQDATVAAPVLASADMRLLNTTLQSGAPVQVWAISPSPEDVLNATREFANLFVGAEAPVVPAAKQNSTSVVLQIRIGSDTVLLGSDLENVAPPQRGWNAIVAKWDHSAGSASAFKVPHHGSEGAFSQALWDNYIQAAALAVLTPYASSGLPRSDQLKRLRQTGRSIYATALIQPEEVRRSLAVEKVIRRRAKSISALKVEQNGVVRLRKRATEKNWTVELFGTATKV